MPGVTFEIRGKSPHSLTDQIIRYLLYNMSSDQKKAAEELIPKFGISKLLKQGCPQPRFRYAPIILPQDEAILN